MKKLMMILSSWLFTLVILSPATANPAAPVTPSGGIKSIEERIKALEEASARKTEDHKWYDRIQLSGVVEVEASNYKIDYEDNEEATDEKGTDVDLENVELAMDAKIAAHVEGHARLKWEAGDEEVVFMDEGFITLTGSERFPLYLIAGRQYVPFGNFESHFVTDPTTLLLAETNDGAVVLGYHLLNDIIDVSAGAYNGKAHKADSDNDSEINSDINSFVASITIQPMEALNFGASYTSNLAGAMEFNEQLTDAENLDALVGGWSVFAVCSFLDRFKLIGEYVGALDHFKAGELYDTEDTKERQPTAWNTELGVTLIEALEIAFRYGGSDDGGTEFMPETQYGAVLNWGFSENTNLALEYLQEDFKEDVQKVDVFTAQLAVEF